MENTSKKDRNFIIPNVLGVIPCRGGSKRLPRKNIKLMAGLPLIVYTIQAAEHSKRLTDYIVSSEDKEIIKIAKEYGAPVPFIRPAELATDDVRNIDVVDHALKFMENKKGIIYDILVLLQPTCPIRNPRHIDLAIEMLANSDLDTLVSVKGPFKKRDPILKAIRNDILEDYIPVDDIRNVEPFYLYNAALYAVKRNYFIQHKKLISPKQVPLVMDQFHSIDIDTEADFIIAEAYLKFMEKKKRGKRL